MPLNDSYEPTDGEEDVLDILKEEGKARPVDIYERLGVGEASAQHWIGHLLAAGWISKPKRGLYEFEHDPREMDDEELASFYADYATDLDDGRKAAQKPQ